MAKKKDVDIRSSIAHKVLVEPWVTEETTRIGEYNKYVFKVVKDADKKSIKKAVEGLYGVEVTSVNTINIPRKKRIRGRVTGWKSGYKKAIVTLKEGDKIEFFEGK
jgi:large subunit ribosomal protein L23